SVDFISHGTHLYLHSFPTRRSSDLNEVIGARAAEHTAKGVGRPRVGSVLPDVRIHIDNRIPVRRPGVDDRRTAINSPRSTNVQLDRKSTRLNSSHEWISYAVFCLKK